MKKKPEPHPEQLTEVIAITANGESSTELLAPKVEFDVQQYESLLTRAQKLATLNAKVSISAKYREFTNPGETERGIFLGFTTIQKRVDGELVDLQVAQWLAPDGSLFINGGVNIVRTLETVPVGTPIEITFEGRKDKTKLFNIRILG